MHWLSELGRRIKMLSEGYRFDVDLEEEMRLHLELRQQEQMESGMSAEDARFAARRRFGNATLLKENSHMAWGWEWLDNLMQDVHYGVRAMLRSPGITLVALLSLALGIGANTAIFSLMDAVMLRTLPVKQPGQLVLIGDGDLAGESDDFAFSRLYSYPFYREMQRKNQVFSELAAMMSMPNQIHGAVEGRSDPEPMNVQLVSGTYFPMLGVNAFAGRTLTDEDDKTEGGHPVAVVSYAWWARNLGRDASVLNKKLTIGSTVFTIVGVAPQEFFGTKVGESPDIWIPLAMQKEVPPGWDGYNDISSESLHLMGRLKSGVSLAQAKSNVNLLFQQIFRDYAGPHPTPKNLQALQNAHVDVTSMATGLSTLRQQFSEPLKILMVVVGLVLLIACANIANLLLARSTARAREFAMRQALGARRSRLIRQLLTESLVLALAGGALGVAFASGTTRLLLRMVSGGPETLPLDVSLNIPLLLFALAITLLTVLLFGVVPALRATSLQLTESLKTGRGTAGSSAKNLTAKMLVVSQVAFSLVLLVAAGLFLRSLVNLTRVDTGFNRENVLLLQTDASSVGYKEGDARLASLYQQIEDRVSALPGVRAASFSSFTFPGGGWNSNVVVEGAVEQNQDQKVDVRHNLIGNGYFQTMGIPLLAGRTFGPQDTSTSQKVAVISERMAHTMFPQGSPIGRRFGMYDAKHAGDIEVIGVVKDVKFGSLQEDPETLDYIPYTQRVRYLDDFEVRYTKDSEAIASAVRRTIHEVDPHLPISNVTTFDEQVARTIINQRLVAQLSTFFGLLAVFLSCIGIYGLMSYAVLRRTNEIGIRMALGAERSRVLWMVMQEVLLLVVAGIGIGVPLALAGDRLVSSMLFGLRGTDPVSLLSAVALLLVIAVIAGYLPSRRASQVDPVVALRYE